MGQPETPADQPATREYGLDFLGYRVGRDVVILGHLAQQQVAHAAADDIRLVPFFLQTAHHLGRVRTELLDSDAVFLERNDYMFSDIWSLISG